MCCFTRLYKFVLDSIALAKVAKALCGKIRAMVASYFSRFFPAINYLFP